MKKVKSVKISSKIIFDNQFIYIQSMCSIPYSKLDELENQILKISRTNCSLIRLSIRNENEIKIAKSLKDIYERDDFIFVADTHFNPKITYECIKNGFKKVRINPGNMNLKEMKDIAKIAKDFDATIRIGLNGGSINEKIGFKGNIKDIIHLFASYIEPFEKEGLDKIVLSAKFSDYKYAIKVNEALNEEFDYPIHLGVTEAGGLKRSTILHTLFLEQMIKKGIGSTVRISITGDSINEIDIANEILKSLGIYKGIELISCPTCGRTWGNLVKYLLETEEKVKSIEYEILKRDKMPKKSIKCAIMGCEVNGPIEAKEADIGVSLTKNGAILFKNGGLIKKIEKEDISDELCTNIKHMINQN